MATTTTSPPAQASNAELVRWAFDALNRRDLASLREFWTPETIERFPDRTCHGTDEIARYFEDTFAAMDDWRVELLSVVEQGEDVLARWRISATHTGTMLGVDATGRSLAVDGMDHFVIRDGKLVSNFVVFDQMQFARQVGLMPEDGSAPDRALKAAFNARTKLLEKLGR